MMSDAPVSVVVQAIQLAVAPVFLLTGIGATLGVLTSRLARIVDRARVLEGRLPTEDGDERARLHDALTTLCRRARLINWAISLCTTSALLICTVIVVLFLEALVAVDLPGAIPALFIGAMLALIAGLISFLREVYLAIANLRIGPPGSGRG
jgi:Protein of unknown function (DUF2721)